MLSFGVDIGGTNARAALVDVGTGQVVAVEKAPLTNHSPEAVVGTVARMVGVLAQGRSVADLRVGVGFAGMLRGSVVMNAPNLGWREVDFGGELQRALGRQVRLVNDLRAAAWGEFSAGASRGATDVFTVFVGTGVGSAIIANGRLVNGATGVAGEFGHTKVVLDDGRDCGCGERGCLEAYAGGARLAMWMQEVGLAGTATELERQAQAGQPEAVRLYTFVAGALGLAIANQVTVLNPQVVVLGGGVLARAPGLVERLTDVVRRRASAASRRLLSFELARLGDDSGLVGAALLGNEA